MPFQPTRRTGLNRTVLLSPGAPWHGARAGRALGATSRLDDDQWLQALEHLVSTLVQPTREDRESRSDWDGTDWDRWAQLERIVLCGGVLAGDRGDLVRSRCARPVPGPHARPPVALEVESDPAAASLRGLSLWPPVAAPTLVLDLGHTAVKAALSTGPGLLGPVVRTRVPWTPFDLGTWPAPSLLLRLVRETAAAVSGRFRRRAVTVTGPGDAAPVETAPIEARVAIANYVVDGRLDDDDTWGTLAGPGGSAAERLSRELGLPVGLLVNDGQAAALGRAGQPHTAVISIGTSLGVGFPPSLSQSPQPRLPA